MGWRCLVSASSGGRRMHCGGTPVGTAGPQRCRMWPEHPGLVRAGRRRLRRRASRRRCAARVLARARIFGLVFYLAVCWLAVRTTPVGKPFLVLIALLPTPVMLATTLSADPVPISLGLLSVALLLRLRLSRADEHEPDPTGWLLASFAGCLVLLAFSKNLYAVVGLLVLLVPGERFSSPRRRWQYAAGLLAAIAAAFLVWTAVRPRPRSGGGAVRLRRLRVHEPGSERTRRVRATRRVQSSSGPGCCRRT